MIKLFKNGENIGMSTDAQDEIEFLHQFSELMSVLIEEGKYKKYWKFQLNDWIQPMIEMCYKYRGCKSDQGMMFVGSLLLMSYQVASIDDRYKTHFIV